MTDARPGVGILENRRRETTMSDKKWIKAEDVARLAGVSRSAVSRTFTPGASVSEKTRQKVLSAAEALGYQVNIIARTMITGSSNFYRHRYRRFRQPVSQQTAGAAGPSAGAQRLYAAADER